MVRERRPDIYFFIVIAWCCLLQIATDAWCTEEIRFALIIGCNGTNNSTQRKLRYADDDAIKNAILMRELGAEVVLLTSMDTETRDLYPNERPTVPTTFAINEGWQRINMAMKEARREGKKPIFYFIYSGHGDVKHHQGYVLLQGGRFWRRELHDMISKSNAWANHVIIDACKSYFMIFGRGVGGQRRSVIRGAGWQQRKPPPNTGVMLSASAAQESHEWEAFQSGVFSHELRSALRGAADSNKNGKISYLEAAAYIWNANRSILNRRFRPSFFAYQPTDPAIAKSGLISFTREEKEMLQLTDLHDSHYFIEDSDGNRIADFHPEDREQLFLLLPDRTLFLKESKTGKERRITNIGRLYLERAEWGRQQTAPRGAHHEAFNRLFRQPFRLATFGAYESWIHKEASDEETTFSPWWHRSIGMSAVTLGIAGAVMHLSAYNCRVKGNESLSGVEAGEANQRIDTFNALAMGFYIGAGVAALAAFALWGVFTSNSKEQPIRTNVFDLSAPISLAF